jgi:hypothetical protein
MAFEAKDIDPPKPEWLLWATDDAMELTVVSLSTPTFVVMEMPFIYPWHGGVQNPKLSVSRTRDRFSMTSEGKGLPT